MGNCNSVICSQSTVEKVGKIEKVAKKEESGEIEETPVVAISIRCPSNTGSWESSLELNQDTRAAEAVSSSVESLGTDTDDELNLSSDTSSFLSEDERDVTHPQEEEGAWGTRVKCCLPRSVRHHGLGKQNDDKADALATVENPAFSSSKNKRQLEQASNGGGETRNWAKESPGPSGLHSTPKQKEQLAAEKLKRKTRRFPRMKRVRSQEEEMHANKVRLIKKIKNAIKKQAAQESDSRAAALPTDETIARIFGVTVEDCRDSSSSNSSSSCSPASSTPSTAGSWDSSITSDEDLEEPRTDSHSSEVQTVSQSANNKPEKSAKTRSRVTASRKTFTISNGDLNPQRPSIGAPRNGTESTSECFNSGQNSVETRPPCRNAWDSWDSFTASDEEFAEPNVGHPDMKVKSTSESSIQKQRGSATNNPSCSTNSWDSSTILERDGSSEPELTLESVNSCESFATPGEELQKLSTPESAKNEERSSPTPSRDSSINSDEGIAEESLESARNMQTKARRIFKWFRFKNNKVAPL